VRVCKCMCVCMCVCERESTCCCSYIAEFLAVDPSARGMGIGKSLLKQCEAKAKEWGYKEIVLQVAADNIVATNLYKKAGYSVIAEDNTIVRPKDGGIFGGMAFEPTVHLCMRKDLNGPTFPIPTFSLPKLF